MSEEKDDPLAGCPLPAFSDVRPIKGAILTKQGERNKASIKEYLFLLEGEYLYYYSDNSDTVPRGVIWLSGSSVNTGEQNNTSKLKSLQCFVITAKKGWNVKSKKVFKDREYYLYAKDFTEMNEWMALVNKTSRGTYSNVNARTPLASAESRKSLSNSKSQNASSTASASAGSQ